MKICELLLPFNAFVNIIVMMIIIYRRYVIYESIDDRNLVPIFSHISKIRGKQNSGSKRNLSNVVFMPEGKYNALNLFSNAHSERQKTSFKFFTIE